LYALPSASLAAVRMTLHSLLQPYKIWPDPTLLSQDAAYHCQLPIKSPLPAAPTRLTLQQQASAYLGLRLQQPDHVEVLSGWHCPRPDAWFDLT